MPAQEERRMKKSRCCGSNVWRFHEPAILGRSGIWNEERLMDSRGVSFFHYVSDAKLR